MIEWWSDWVIAVPFAVIFLIIILVIGWRNTQRQIAQTVARRPNPSREEFLALMAPDVSLIATEFLWENSIEMLSLFKGIGPHPDDDLARDLPMDEEEWSMDWPVVFAERHGFSDKLYPDWPDGWPATIRNYGKWLDMGLAEARKDSPSTSSG